MSDANTVTHTLPGWLAAQHPDAADIRLEHVRNPAQGYSNETFFADLHWARDGRSETVPLVVRLENRSAGTFPDYDLSLQYRCMEALQGTPVPVPHLLGFEADAEPLGAPFYLMEKVAGQVPNENPLYHVEGWMHELPESGRAQLWFQGLEVVAHLGRVDWRSRGLDFLARPALGADPTDQALEYFRRHMVWAEELGRPYPHLHRGWQWLDSHRPKENEAALCWGDAKLGNCIYDQGKLVAALDWEGAHLGNPVFDLAWWITIDRCLSEGYGIPRLAGLPSRAESIACWEAASGRKAEHLEYFEFFSAFKLASIMARIGTVFRQRGMVPAEFAMDTDNGAAAVLARFCAEYGA